MIGYFASDGDSTPLLDGSQQNLGLTSDSSDSSQFVCHRIECAQRV